jgi:hypothetical protein
MCYRIEFHGGVVDGFETIHHGDLPEVWYVWHLDASDTDSGFCHSKCGGTTVTDCSEGEAPPPGTVAVEYRRRGNYKDVVPVPYDLVRDPAEVPAQG